MVQFNLLPDVKKEYIKTKRTKRVIASFSFLITSIFVGITILLFLFVRFAQTKNINDLSNDIKTETNRIQSTEDLARKLTVQNQLTILTPVHEQKPEVSRVFEYVKLFSPETTELSTLVVNTTENTIKIEGSISTLAEANRLVDNIKSVRYATYKSGEEPVETATQLAYEIVDSSVSSTGEEARFEIDFIYQADIFDNTLEVVMQLLDRRISTASEGEGN